MKRNCNCNRCRHRGINSEAEYSLHPEYETIDSRQGEWSSYLSQAKNYISPFFSWLGGSQPASPAVKAPAPSTGTTVKPVSESQYVSSLVAAGNRSENSLTDAVVYRRHPELGGRPISNSMSNYSVLVNEWVTIRNTVVRPVLGTPATSTPPTGSSSSSGYTGPAKASLQKILNAMQRKGYVIYTKPYQLNIVGVRSSNAQANSFDDSINVFYKDNFGNWQYSSNPATTDPGTYYLNNPMNVDGTAIVVPGQYINSHQIGLHRSSYTALVQQGPLKVIRDTNKDNTLDFGSSNVITGVYGINIHKAGSSSTSVDKWSAGCQVFARSSDFDAFIRLCQQHSSLYGNNFTYTLLEERDLI